MHHSAVNWIVDDSIKLPYGPEELKEAVDGGEGELLSTQVEQDSSKEQEKALAESNYAGLNAKLQERLKELTLQGEELDKEIVSLNTNLEGIAKKKAEEQQKLVEAKRQYELIALQAKQALLQQQKQQEAMPQAQAMQQAQAMPQAQAMQQVQSVQNQPMYQAQTMQQAQVMQQAQSFYGQSLQYQSMPNQHIAKQMTNYMPQQQNTNFAANSQTMANSASVLHNFPNVAANTSLPLRPNADIFIEFSSNISYINNLLDFLIKKGLNVAFFKHDFQYRMDDIILLANDINPRPSFFSCVMPPDLSGKRVVWDFLKVNFAQRGFPLA